jgi:hypothetical protein
MWNYLSGVKPPSESEKKKRKFESNKEYYKGILTQIKIMRPYYYSGS